TTYRPNAVTGSVLSVGEASDDAPEADRGAEVVYIARPMDRPEALEGRTYKIRWPESEHAIYITINDTLENGRRRPFEVFMNSKNMEHYAWTLALTRMISAVFRRGGDVRFVAEELKAVFDPRGGAWMEGRYVPSILAAIGGVIERHLIETGFVPDPDWQGLGRPDNAVRGAIQPDPDRPSAEVVTLNRKPSGPTCPNCGGFGTRMIEGCLTCGDCGHSKCG
ncbi:MAG: ribonucleoside-diphosphate reductase, adenosylcobalamin-dependent, partial [Paracoccaceae bacterium]|nr:ribonucleoside-diphosphate reductase, adenosylcobalamin-dependent [Paracoccaceae bacterium]